MAQQVDQAMAVYLEMVASAVAPNQATFSLMMRTAGASGRLQHALAVFGEMKAAGIAPNLDIYNHLIVACGNAPQPQVSGSLWGGE
jgi:pentatricopeptide repeat protein